MDRRIGAQFYTIKQFCQNLEDFDESCRKVKEMGYNIIQLSGTANFSGEEVKSVIKKHDLEVVVTHREEDDFLEHLEEEIKFHKTIGCNVLGIANMPGKKVDDETINTFINNYKPVADKLKEHGLYLAYHNHAFEFAKKNGKYAFDIITEAMASDNFKYILDTYWLAYAGINPAKFIRERKGLISCVHLKDLKIVGSKPIYAEIGQGNIDWDDVLAACEDAKVEYVLVEQDVCEGNPFDSLKISIDYLKTKGF